MKKLLVSAFLLCAFNGAIYAEDGFTVSNVDLELGGDEETCFTVSLSGETIYTAFNMDIYLPDGIEVTMTDGDYDVYMNYDDDVYPYTGKETTKPTSTRLVLNSMLMKQGDTCALHVRQTLMQISRRHLEHCLMSM